jgi:FKBP-type peptidyl-prolyl cis-trans isomerase FkpA
MEGNGMKSIWAVVAAVAVLVGAVVAARAWTPQDRSQDMKWQSEQQLALARLKSAEGWRPLERGLLWRRIKGDGRGAHPSVADTVRLHYAGTLTDGTEFDSSWARGEPAEFPLSALIEAWQLAVPQMGVGDTIELAVPAALGYGPEGKGPIPGGATLMFRIELLGITGR